MVHLPIRDMWQCDYKGKCRRFSQVFTCSANSKIKQIRCKKFLSRAVFHVSVNAPQDVFTDMRLVAMQYLVFCLFHLDVEFWYRIAK